MQKEEAKTVWNLQLSSSTSTELEPNSFLRRHKMNERSITKTHYPTCAPTQAQRSSRTTSFPDGIETPVSRLWRLSKRTEKMELLFAAVILCLPHSTACSLASTTPRSPAPQRTNAEDVPPCFCTSFKTSFTWEIKQSPTVTRKNKPDFLRTFRREVKKLKYMECKRTREERQRVTLALSP